MATYFVIVHMVNNNEGQIGVTTMVYGVKQDIYDYVYAACRRDWDWM